MILSGPSPREPDYEPLSDAVEEIEPEFLEALMRLIDLPVESGPDSSPALFVYLKGHGQNSSNSGNFCMAGGAHWMAAM